MLDLGSGAGIPGLVLADAVARVRGMLVESGHRRCEHLRREIDGLGWTARVEVLEERAELTARRPELRESVELVTARSFATPAATAEIAAGVGCAGRAAGGQRATPARTRRAGLQPGSRPSGSGRHATN